MVATLVERTLSAVGRGFQSVRVFVSEVSPHKTASAVIRLDMRWDLASLLKMVHEQQLPRQAES